VFALITLNHFRAIKAWGEMFGAQVSLNALTFELEVKALNRYVTLYPQFIARINQKLAHVQALTPEVTGFIGWRPYKPFRHPLSTDKLRFKKAAVKQGLATPPFWMAPADAETDFVIKSSTGSFGNDLTGPYRHAQRQKALVWPKKPALANGSEFYAESFVQGRNIKVWFWGAQAVHAQNQPYTRVTGDGQRSVRDLLNGLLFRMGQSWNDYPEKDTVVQCLRYQELTLDATLPHGAEAWPDYRYGRQFSDKNSTEQKDNALPRFSPEQAHQIQTAGNWLVAELAQDIRQPVLLTLDGVEDSHGHIWWLEMNTNPIFPPTGYFAMLGSLFGTPPDTPAHVFSRPHTEERISGMPAALEIPGASAAATENHA
jgi:hypothetical protein